MDRWQRDALAEPTAKEALAEVLDYFRIDPDPTGVASAVLYLLGERGWKLEKKA